MGSGIIAAKLERRRRPELIVAEQGCSGALRALRSCRGGERGVLEHTGPVLDQLDAVVEGAAVDHLEGDVGVAVVDALGARGAGNHREHHDPEAIDESGSQRSRVASTFRQLLGPEPPIGLWSGTIPLASVFGMLLGGLLSEGPGWCWVFLVNLPVCALVLVGAFRLLRDDRRRAPLRDFDALGAVLSTAGMLVLVYSLVKAPEIGWEATRTIAGLGAALVLLVTFVATELRRGNPLFQFSIFWIRGLGAADATQVIAQAGFYSMFFFITLYMQNVLGFTPIRAGAA
jgi:hypothetical protein